MDDDENDEEGYDINLHVLHLVEGPGDKVELVKKYIEQGADINYEAWIKMSTDEYMYKTTSRLVQVAISKRREKIASYLIDNNADLSIPVVKQDTPIINGYLNLIDTEIYYQTTVELAIKSQCSFKLLEKIINNVGWQDYDEFCNTQIINKDIKQKYLDYKEKIIINSALKNKQLAETKQIRI